MQKITNISICLVLLLQFFCGMTHATSAKTSEKEKKPETVFPWLSISPSLGVQFWDSGNRDFEGKVFSFHIAPILAIQGEASISYHFGYIALSGSLPLQPLFEQAGEGNIIRFSGGIFQRISPDPFFHLALTFNAMEVNGEVITQETRKDFTTTQYATEVTIQGHPEQIFSPKVGIRYKGYNTPAALMTIGGTKRAPTNYSVLYENLDADDLSFICGLSMKRKKLFILDFNVAAYMGSTFIDPAARAAAEVNRGGANLGAYGSLALGLRVLPWKRLQGGITVGYDWDWHYFSAGKGSLEGTPDKVKHFRAGKVMRWEDVLHTLRVSLLFWW